jgi:hypothetical protein
MGLDEAIAILVELLQAGRAGYYGYDLYARRGAEEAVARMRPRPLEDQSVIRDLSPVFYEAAWELCRRGIVRPGIKRAGEQAVEEGGYAYNLLRYHIDVARRSCTRKGYSLGNSKRR